MARKIRLFRVGKVAVYLRGKVWYLCYYEHGRRRRPRVGPDKELARRLAAQTNAQLEVGAPTALSFEPVSIAELRERWLHYHEHVLRVRSKYSSGLKAISTLSLRCNEPRISADRHDCCTHPERTGSQQDPTSAGRDCPQAAER